MIKENRTNHTTSAANQRAFILTYLEQNGSATTLDFRNHGIMAPAARIIELKEKGYKISKTLEDQNDHTGVKHGRVARYFLQGVNHDNA